MSLICDVIELVHRHGLVRVAALDHDGCDVYEIATAEPVTVRVRPDGRFSCAIADGGFVTLGQVMRRVLAAIGSGRAREASERTSPDSDECLVGGST